ncbi:hypothetical protein [Roseixanthobacter glucoisosaccharinicivorans]|uniref:hypothetical protein n=1 Tax=Roseixanthobacter glucoisosaccharinicivorans TaxID=3119923 RepID=UPI00372BDC7C
MLTTHYLCFVALPEEMEYIHNVLVGCDFQYADLPFRSRSSHQYLIKSDRNALAPCADIDFVILSGMGNICSATAVGENLRADRNYKSVFLLGLSGTLQPNKFRLGDVVISSAVKYFTFDKIKELSSSEEEFEGSTNPDPSDSSTSEAFDGAPNADPSDSSTFAKPAKVKHIISRSKSIAQNSWLRIKRDFVTIEKSGRLIQRYLADQNPSFAGFAKVTEDLIGVPSDLINDKPRIHIGALLGSDWVIDSQEYVDFFNDRNEFPEKDWYIRKGGPDTARTKWYKSDIAAVDMESYGFLKSISLVNADGMHAICIRGISDRCSGKGLLDNTTQGAIRNIAIRNATVTLVDLIHKILPRS